VADEPRRPIAAAPFPDLFRLDGRVALVTGGAGLLGRGYCEALLQAGARVVIADLDGAQAHDLAKQLSTNDALGLQMDVSNESSVNRSIEMATNHFGRIDILVNNAALTVRGGSERLQPADYFAPFEEYKREVWDQALSVNLTGMLLCAQAAGKLMLRQDPPGGVMVNISSTYGVVAPDQRLYDDVKSPYAETGFNTPVSHAVT
jgi:NAD(P)-dependent dehydrogenase (short-subunit alcohol dehydrogenase family)